MALAAVRLNCLLNHVTVDTNSDDLIESAIGGKNVPIGPPNSFQNGLTANVSKNDTDFAKLHLTADVILVGDMFYDEQMTERIMVWLSDLSTPCRQILLGDPGRPYFHKYRHLFTQVADYDMTPTSRLENNGLTSARVYRWIH